MSCHCRWPGVWSMNETMRKDGSAIKRLEQPEHVRVDDLQAQMQEMVGLERPGRLGPVQHLDRQAEILQPLALAAVEADADRVADGGDPGGGHLRIVGEHGGVGGPAHARARREQALEIVGVQLDQARHAASRRRDRPHRGHGCGTSATSAIRPSRTTSVPSTTASAVTIRALVSTSSSVMRQPLRPMGQAPRWRRHHRQPDRGNRHDHHCPVRRIQGRGRLVEQ